MAARTAQEFAQQLVAQLRATDPALSAEVGSPERKLLDTVALALSEAQIDLTVLGGALDLDAKFGDTLDKFLGVLGFGRQSALRARGFVTFSRPLGSTYDILIPVGTQVQATAADNAVANYQTTLAVTLPAGATAVSAPIEALVAGAAGNALASAIATLVNNVPGITTVTNPAAIIGGLDPESDNELKVRFKNTVFRNLAGTYDQYLALSVSTPFTSKANVIGPISRYIEYIQVPVVDDATIDPNNGVGGAGTAAEYTTALSTIPYSKYIYTVVPHFVSNGDAGVRKVFYREDTDFVMNIASKDRGDAHRLFSLGIGSDPSDSVYQPNVTFKNVYTGDNPALDAIRPGDIVQFEHSYMSSESRNDSARNVNNCIDIYINGGNEIFADTVIPRPALSRVFVNNIALPYYFEKYRRFGEPHRRPLIGNLFTPLFWQPLLNLPTEIVVGEATYFFGTHYWLVSEIDDLGGTIRARDGIEWSANIGGKIADDPDEGPYTGDPIGAAAEESVGIFAYSFDQNIVDIQSSVEGAKQITTDVLVHRSLTRYFKLDVTVMYSAGASISDTDTAIGDALRLFFNSQYYGTTVQLSDLLQTIHNVTQVDNVRWSFDLNPTRNRIVETDQFGTPLLAVLTDRKVQGDVATTEIQQFYIAGGPTAGSYTVTYNSVTSPAIAFGAGLVATQAAFTGASVPVTLSGAGTPASPFVATFTGVGARDLLVFTADFTAGETAFNADFFLKDNELPTLPLFTVDGDTVPGVIVRAKSAGTWGK